MDPKDITPDKELKYIIQLEADLKERLIIVQNWKERLERQNDI